MSHHPLIWSPRWVFCVYITCPADQTLHPVDSVSISLPTTTTTVVHDDQNPFLPTRHNLNHVDGRLTLPPRRQNGQPLKLGIRRHIRQNVSTHHFISFLRFAAIANSARWLSCLFQIVLLVLYLRTQTTFTLVPLVIYIFKFELQSKERPRRALVFLLRVGAWHANTYIRGLTPFNAHGTSAP